MKRVRTGGNLGAILFMGSLDGNQDKMGGTSGQGRCSGKKGKGILRKAALGGNSDAALALKEILEEEDAQEEVVELLRGCAQSGGAGVILSLADLFERNARK
ncbi:hypothetical protein GCM10020295_81300 [Streptomyces cinereospinus]